MRSPQPLSLIAALLAILPVTSAASQYCYSSQAEPSSFCAAFAQAHNATTDGTDLYLSISALPTPRGGGWLAVGTGEVMAGSLMFIIWADQERETLAVSVRTVVTHTEPRPSAGLPQVEVLRATASKDASHEAVLVCRSCDRWAELDFTSPAHPWIWASNYFGTLGTADPDVHISIHQLHDVFYVDMASIPSISGTEEAELPPPPPRQPEVRGSANQGTWDAAFPLDSKKPSGVLAVAVVWHGLILSIAFMGVMVPSSVYTTWFPRSRIHPVSQSVGLVVTLVGFGVAIYPFELSRIATKPHQLVGGATMFIVLLLVYSSLQMLARSSPSQETSLHSLLHILLGRTVSCLGIVNVGLGLFQARRPLVVMAVWASIAVFELLVYAFAIRRQERLKQRQLLWSEEEQKREEHTGLNGDLEHSVNG